jgi:hypothetical protein
MNWYQEGIHVAETLVTLGTVLGFLWHQVGKVELAAKAFLKELVQEATSDFASRMIERLMAIEDALPALESRLRSEVETWGNNLLSEVIALRTDLADAGIIPSRLRKTATPTKG